MPDELMADLQSPSGPIPYHVSVVALPDAVASTLFGIFDVMNAFPIAGLSPPEMGTCQPLHAEIVGLRTGSLTLASRVPIEVQRAVDSIDATDVVIVPSVLLGAEGWQKGRYPELVAWLLRMHEHGAILCSACSGIFLLAETGLFDGRHASVHYGYASAFAATFPSVQIHPERVLVVSGTRDELVSSGASTTWHDMALYLVARYAGATVALEVARMFALQWHQNDLTPYMSFQGKMDHNDGHIRSAQLWLSKHFSVSNAVEEMIKRSSLAERTFKRRFTSATGLAPIAYVQRLRIEDAKRRLERTDASVDEISWKVGYEDSAFFRRLFKRTTGLTPGAYRKRFRIPEFARPSDAPGDSGTNDIAYSEGLNGSAPKQNA